MVNGLLPPTSEGGKFCRVDGCQGMNLPASECPRFLLSIYYQKHFGVGTSPAGYLASRGLGEPAA
jgi:hypothetical protein